MMTPMDEGESAANAILPNFSNWMRSTTTNYSDDIGSQSDDDSSATSENMGNYDVSDSTDNKHRGNAPTNTQGAPRNTNVSGNTRSNNGGNGNTNNNVNNNANERREAFMDEGLAVGQGHRHGATVYDDWGLPISNPSYFREGRNMCRPWLIAVNILAIGLVVGIIVHGGPSSDYEYRRYNWYGQEIMEEPETTWQFLGEEMVGPIPDRHEAENRLVGFGHHLAMNEEGDRIAVARTSGHGNSPGEVYVYSWKEGFRHKHNHPATPGKWRLEQVLTAKLSDEDLTKFHTGQQHTPLAMSASGHRVAFTEGDHVFIFESPKQGKVWKQIAKVQSLDHDAEDAEEEGGSETQALTSGNDAEEDEAVTEKENSEEEEAETVLEGEDDEKPATAATPKKAATTKTKKKAASTTTKTKTKSKAAVEDEADIDDDDDDQFDDDDDDDGDSRKLANTDWERSGNHFGKHLAFSHDGGTLAVMGFSRAKGGYIRVFQDEAADVHHEDHEEVVHIFEPTPDIFLEEYGDSLALSGDGTKIAVGIATSDAMGSQGTHTGIVQVYAINKYNLEWSRIGQPIFGDYAMEGFGGTLSLSEDGLVLAVGVAFGGGPVKAYDLVELNHLAHEFEWQQRGKTLTGSNHREHFGNQVRLSYDGSFLAVGAPGSPDMLESDEAIDDEMVKYLHGKAYRFKYSHEGHDWLDDGLATSSYEGDAFGYSLAISGDGERVVVGAPFRIVEDELNVGVVQVFGEDEEEEEEAN